MSEQNPTATSVDCPDCQLQLIQQPSPPTDLHPLTSSSSGSSSRLPDFPLLPPGPSSYPHPPLPRCPLNQASSSVYSFGGGTGGGDCSGQSTPTSSISTCNLLSGNELLPYSASESQDYGGNAHSHGHSHGMLCSCSALDYRARSNVTFPPIFYPQGPATFSSFDCWGNEGWNNHAPYPYIPPFPPQTPTPSSSSADYYQASQDASASFYETCFPQMGYKAQEEAQSKSPLSMATLSASVTMATVTASSSLTTANVNVFSPKRQSQSPSLSSNKNPQSPSLGVGTPISVVETSSSVEMSDSSDASDSDDDDDGSQGSEDRELISVVEEDEDEEDESGGTHPGPGGKCMICQNLIDITDVSSPQLVRFLENIHEIEDLELTVSSGDIEIGGMEDEMNKDASSSKRRHFSAPSELLSVSRLSLLLGLPVKSFLTETETDQDQAGGHFSGSRNEADMAILCFRCGKLASMADSLERQMSATLHALQQQLKVVEGGEKLSCPQAQAIPPAPPPPVEQQLCIVSRSVGVQTEVESVASSTQVCISDLLFPSFTDAQAQTEELEASDEESSTGEQAEEEENDRVGLLFTRRDSESSCPSSIHVSTPQGNEEKIALDLITSDPEPLILDPSISEGQKGQSENDPLSSPPAKKRFNCQHCQKGFSTLSNLKQHSRICSRRAQEENLPKEALSCSKCGVTFRSKARMAVHLDDGCRPLIHECDQCPRKFAKTSELETHRKVHNGEKPFKCEKCRRAFATKGNLSAHLRTHEDFKLYPCPICDKGFSRKFALTLHLNRHNGIKPFHCADCPQSFPDPSYLNKHRKKAHPHPCGESNSDSVKV